MKYVLTSHLSNVACPGHPKPDDRAIYAIPFRGNQMFAGVWLPEGTEVERPGDHADSEWPEELPKNPLQVTRPGQDPLPYLGRGEVFKLSDGDWALVINHKALQID